MPCVVMMATLADLSGSWFSAGVVVMHNVGSLDVLNLYGAMQKIGKNV